MPDEPKSAAADRRVFIRGAQQIQFVFQKIFDRFDGDARGSIHVTEHRLQQYEDRGVALIDDRVEGLVMDDGIFTGKTLGDYFDLSNGRRRGDEGAGREWTIGRVCSADPCKQQTHATDDTDDVPSMQNRTGLVPPIDSSRTRHTTWPL